MIHYTYVEIKVHELVGERLQIIHQFCERGIPVIYIFFFWGKGAGTCLQTREIIRKLVHSNSIACLREKRNA